MEEACEYSPTMGMARKAPCSLSSCPTKSPHKRILLSYPFAPSEPGGKATSAAKTQPIHDEGHGFSRAVWAIGEGGLLALEVRLSSRLE